VPILLRRVRRGVRRVVWGRMMWGVGWIAGAIGWILWGIRVIRNGRLGWWRDLKGSLRGGVRVHHQVDLFLTSLVPKVNREDKEIAVYIGPVSEKEG
jgi:hypothetical protein